MTDFIPQGDRSSVRGGGLLIRSCRYTSAMGGNHWCSTEAGLCIPKDNGSQARITTLSTSKMGSDGVLTYLPSVHMSCFINQPNQQGCYNSLLPHKKIFKRSLGWTTLSRTCPALECGPAMQLPRASLQPTSSCLNEESVLYLVTQMTLNARR